MARRNRETLKNYFKQGNRPTEQEFADLVDSSLNILDDGFLKEPDKGVEIAPVLEKETLVSLFKDSIDSDPQWEIAIEKSGGNLQIKRVNHAEKTPLLTLKTDGSVELGESGKTILLPGIVQIPVRRGSLLQGEIPADGKWHDMKERRPEGHTIPRIWTGSQALEITASVGIAGSGRHAILVAVATTCFGKHSRIRKTASHYGSWGNKICIRWRKTKGHKQACTLQMKTVLKYDNETVIRYYVSSLWE